MTVQEIIFREIDFEQFTVEQLISSNLPDTINKTFKLVFTLNTKLKRNNPQKLVTDT